MLLLCEIKLNLKFIKLMKFWCNSYRCFTVGKSSKVTADQRHRTRPIIIVQKSMKIVPSSSLIQN